MAKMTIGPSTVNSMAVSGLKHISDAKQYAKRRDWISPPFEADELLLRRLQKMSSDAVTLTLSDMEYLVLRFWADAVTDNYNISKIRELREKI